MKSFHSVFLALLAVFTLLPTGCETPDSPQEPSGPVAVESVTVSPQNLELKVGETATLTARIQPSNAQGTLSWTSSNTTVASVANGTVTAVAAGSATITASAGGKSASCQVTVKATQTVVEVESVTLDRHEMTLTEGETNRLVATVSPSNATDKTISWATSNPAIVSVDKEGNVKGVAVGTATVAASHGNLSDACKITVTASAVPVTSISLDKTTLALAEQDTYQLTATVKPDNATDKNVTWSTANAAIATVSDNGLVTAVAEGTTTITAKAGDKTATCAVTVSKKVIPVTSVTLNKTSLALTEQETFQLAATVSPDNATDKNVTWSSSNTAIATVSDNGLVTAVAEGSMTITAKAGDKTATCTVTVSKKVIPVTSVTLNKTSLALTEQETFQLAATVSPDNATDKTVTWSSSNTAVATVSSNGLLTAVQEGSATITAKAGDKTATCTVTVSKKVIPVTSVTLNKTSLALTEQETFQLAATVSPDNATDKTVTWSSSNTVVATVSDNGLVTAVAEGTTTITAKAGDKTATCAVTVKRNYIQATSITFDDTWFYVDIDKTVKLSYKVTPANADEPLTWTSSNPSRASVDQNGVVTGKTVGAVTITVKGANASASCSVSSSYFAMGINLNTTNVSLEVGDQFQMEGTVIKRPDDPDDDHTVSWSSSDSSVASISSSGLITAKSPGTATIRAWTWCDVTAYCTVTVTKKTVYVTSITLDRTSLEIARGDSYTLQATVLPEDAVNKTVTWSSSNRNVATVDSNGKVTGVKAGTATITAKAGDKTATCEVKVIIPVTSITLNLTSKTLRQNETVKLTATVKPTDATYKDVTWTSDNPQVASVSSDGTVTAVSEGTANISAKAGDQTATCVITVSNAASGSHEGTGTEVWY